MRRELIFAALDSQPVGRVPAAFWFHFLPEAETADWRESPRLLERNFAGHQAFVQKFKPDLVKIMTDGFFFYPTPSLYQPLDLAMVTALDPGRDWIRAQVALARRVRELQEDAAYFYNVFSPITSLRFKLGLDDLKRFYLTQPEAFAKALGRMAQGLANLARAVVTEGRVDGIYLSVQNPDQKVFSTEFQRAALAPGEKAILKAAEEAGGRNILHVCGINGVRNDLSLYADYPAAAYNWSVTAEEVSLAKGRRIFGGKPILGGFEAGPGGLLATGSKDEVKAKARELIKEAGAYGYILGADCAIPSGVGLERLEWVREAGLEAIKFSGLGLR
jgi:uroporphyrinogen decarboxylase